MCKSDGYVASSRRICIKKNPASVWRIEVPARRRFNGSLNMRVKMFALYLYF